jgi:hypothetical protein
MEPSRIMDQSADDVFRLLIAPSQNLDEFSGGNF